VSRCGVLIAKVSNASITPCRSNGRRKNKLSERDNQVMTWLYPKNIKPQLPNSLKNLMCTPSLLFPPKLFIRSSRVNIHGRAAIAKPLVNVSFIGAKSAKLGLWTMWNIYLSLMSPPSLSFPHPWEFRCGEAPNRPNTQTVAAGVDQTFPILCLVATSLPRTTETFWKTMCI